MCRDGGNVVRCKKCGKGVCLKLDEYGEGCIWVNEAQLRDFVCPVCLKKSKIAIPVGKRLRVGFGTNQ